MLKWYYSGYSGLNILLSLISPVSFYFLMQLLENLKLTYVASIKFLLYNAVLNNGMYNEESVKIDLRETAASSPRLPVSFLFVCLFCFTLDSISFGGR